MGEKCMDFEVEDVIIEAGHRKLEVVEKYYQARQICNEGERKRRKLIKDVV